MANKNDHNQQRKKFIFFAISDIFNPNQTKINYLFIFFHLVDYNNNSNFFPLKITKNWN